MLTFPNGGRMVQRASELPDLRRARELFLDVETTSGHPKKTSLNPWFDCSLLGVCVTVKDAAWYVPMRHAHGDNVSVDVVLPWLGSLIKTCEFWVNHNIKYDAHACANEGMFFECTLVCTLTLAKIIDSDRMGYDLPTLSKDWLEEDISYLEKRLHAHLDGAKSKDFGDVTSDIVAEYGCQDVITNRKLWRYLQDKCHDRCKRVWDTEIKLTAALFDMERAGLAVDATELQVTECQILYKLLEIEEQLHEVTGETLRPHVNGDCYDLLCNRYALPVLGWTDKGEPSFDKDALKSYARHPIVVASAELTNVVDLLRSYRKKNTLNNFFVRPYQERSVNGKMHPTYNQAVRTGRLSCKQPNAQQLSKEAKKLIHPDEGCSFASYDYSQIEFRWIVHYIKDEDAIAQYLRDPYTDFHGWVAKLCGVARDPAKNINFAIGFGGGKAKVLTMLASDMSIVSEFAGQGEDFEELCRARANEVYSTYHRSLPGIKGCSRRAANSLKRRGYVFNAYGRHRHLPDKAAFRAFPSIIQSSAADLMKDRLVATAPRYNKFVRDAGISQVACVHDETLFHGPSEAIRDPIVLKTIAETMEDVDYISVPVVVKTGISDRDWLAATENSSFLGR